MTYHLPRIEHWIIHQSVEHYPTTCIRQLFHQPFAEYILLHLKLLTGSDFFYNTASLIITIGSMIAISLMTQLFGLAPLYQWLSGVLFLSMPMTIFQATSTQTDCFAAFFLLCFLYFSLLFLTQNNHQKFSNALYASIALGLGILTKITVAIFAIPFCFWFLIIFIQRYKQYKISHLIGALSVIIFINAPFYCRNFTATGNLLGDPTISHWMQNEMLTIPYFFSNLIRHSASHASLASDWYNTTLDSVIAYVHTTFLGITPHEPQITFMGDKFRSAFFFDEGTVGNFIFFVLFIFCLLYCLRHGQKLLHTPMLWYMTSLLTGFFLFCSIFKWQPWISRLHLPWFAASVPFVTYGLWFAAQKIKTTTWWTIIFTPFLLFTLPLLLNKNHVHKRFIIMLGLGIVMLIVWIKKRGPFAFQNRILILIMLLIIFTLPSVFFNTIRPLCMNTSALLSSREKKYFISLWNDAFTEQYLAAANFLAQRNINKILIDLSWEYPLWVLLQNRCSGVELQTLPNAFKENSSPQAFISDKIDWSKTGPTHSIAEIKTMGPKTKYGRITIVILKGNNHAADN